MGDSEPLIDSVHAAAGSSAAGLAWRYGGELRVTVIAKATVAFAPDAPMPRATPQPVLRADVHHLKNPVRSIRFTNDLSPYLQRVDVLFTGHAHAALGSVRAQPARLALYRDTEAVLDKRILVADPRGFERMPVVYERAFGGVGFGENPFGVGASGVTSGEPNILHATNPTLPSGYAPIGRSWPARKVLRGTTPREVIEGPIADLPDDFDWAYFQAAPPDQQIEDLRGDEWLVLEGLHPTRPIVRTQLPGARAEAWIYGLAEYGQSDGSPVELHIDTVRIDGDEQVVTLVFRGSFTVPDEGALRAVRIRAGVETPDQPIRYRDSAPGPRAGGALVARTVQVGEDTLSSIDVLSEDDLIPIDEPLPLGKVGAITLTGESVGDDPSPILPFQASRHPSPMARTEPRPPPRRRDPDEHTMMFAPGQERAAAARAPLPWRPDNAPPPPLAPLPAPAPPPARASVPPPAEPASAPATTPTRRASPWAEPAPEPAAAAPPPKAPVQKPGVPGASPVIKEKLYGRFGVA